MKLQKELLDVSVFRVHVSKKSKPATHKTTKHKMICKVWKRKMIYGVADTAKIKGNDTGVCM